MLFTSLKIAGAALLGVAALAPSAASAHNYGGAPTPYYSDGYGRGDYGYDRDGYGYDDAGYARGYGERPRSRPAYYRDHRYDRCRHDNTGTILGAIAGGLLGNAAVGHHGSRTAGTLVGAGAGALIGNAADRGCD